MPFILWYCLFVIDVVNCLCAFYAVSLLVYMTDVLSCLQKHHIFCKRFKFFIDSALLNFHSKCIRLMHFFIRLTHLLYIVQNFLPGEPVPQPPRGSELVQQKAGQLCVALHPQPLLQCWKTDESETEICLTGARLTFLNRCIHTHNSLWSEWRPVAMFYPLPASPERSYLGEMHPLPAQKHLTKPKHQHRGRPGALQTVTTTHL